MRIVTLIYVKLILQNMQTQLTFLLEDSLVNPSPTLVKGKARMMNATCGAKCYEQFKKLNRDSSSLKMSLVSRLLMGDWYSNKCALTWKVKGTKFNRLLFQLVPRTLHTEETDAGSLLPTPNSSPREVTEEQTIKRKKIYGGKTRAMYLEHYVAMGMLPTPTAGNENSQHSIAEWGGSGNPMREIPGAFSQLNTRFVAEMMGFPKDWTELPFRNGDKNQ
jgi:hypothetical protein